jgi:small GTP-binding protein
MSNVAGLPQLKLTLMGHVAVGKTSLKERFAKDQFSEKHFVTIGVEFGKKDVFVTNERTQEKTKVHVTLWDTAGQEKYDSMTTSVLRNAHGIILVFDVTQRQTFKEAVEKWRDKAKTHCPDALVLLIGNKSDLSDQRQVTLEEAKVQAEQHRMFYYETSARTGDNVAEAFDAFVSAICTKTNVLSKPVRPASEDRGAVNLLSQPVRVASTSAASSTASPRGDPAPPPKEGTGCGC